MKCQANVGWNEGKRDVFREEAELSCQLENFRHRAVSFDRMRHSRMPCRRDEIQQRVHTIVLEPRVSLDARFFGEDVVVLDFEVGEDFLEAVRSGPERRQKDTFSIRHTTSGL